MSSAASEYIASLNAQIPPPLAAPRLANPAARVASLRRWYRSAEDLFLQAQQHELAGSIEFAYIFYRRFASFFLDSISAHPEFRNSELLDEKQKFTKKCNSALELIARLKNEITESVNSESAESAGAEEENSMENLEARFNKLNGNTNTLSSVPVPVLSEPAAESKSIPDTAKPQISSSSTNSNAKLAAIPAAGVDRWPALRIPSNADSKPKLVSSSAGSSSIPPTRPPQSNSAAYPISQPPHSLANRASANSRPPSVSPNYLPPQRPRKLMDFSTAPPLRRVHIPSSLPLEFLRFAHANTQANIETCAILGGLLKNNEFFITHVILPPQHATSDTCVMEDEEKLLEIQLALDLLTIGFIHTHPTQTCFLSSIDLHTHYSYQLMLAEAIAIVMAPSKIPSQGVFNCTQAGIQALSKCSFSGFHRHEETAPLYGESPHHVFDEGDAVFVDLRNQSKPNQSHHSHSHSHR